MNQCDVKRRTVYLIRYQGDVYERNTHAEAGSHLNLLQTMERDESAAFVKVTRPLWPCEDPDDFVCATCLHKRDHPDCDTGYAHCAFNGTAAKPYGVNIETDYCSEWEKP